MFMYVPIHQDGVHTSYKKLLTIYSNIICLCTYLFIKMLYIHTSYEKLLTIYSNIICLCTYLYIKMVYIHNIINY